MLGLSSEILKKILTLNGDAQEYKFVQAFPSLASSVDLVPDVIELLSEGRVFKAVDMLLSYSGNVQTHDVNYMLHYLMRVYVGLDRLDVQKQHVSKRLFVAMVIHVMRICDHQEHRRLYHALVLQLMADDTLLPNATRRLMLQLLGHRAFAN